VGAGASGFAQWTYGDDPAKSPTKDDVLDNVTLYWLTNTAASSARLYWENGTRGSVIVAAAQRTAEIALPWPSRCFPRTSIAPGELGAARLSQPDLFQRGRQRRSLRGVGAASAL